MPPHDTYLHPSPITSNITDNSLEHKITTLAILFLLIMVILPGCGGSHHRPNPDITSSPSPPHSSSNSHQTHPEKTTSQVSDDPWLALQEQARLFCDSGKAEEAEKTLQEALEYCQGRTNRQNRRRLVTLINLAKVYLGTGRYQLAQKTLHTALTESKQNFGPSSLETASVLGDLAGLYYASGEYNRSMECLQKCLVIRSQLLKKSDPLIIQTQRTIAYLKLQQEKNSELQGNRSVPSDPRQNPNIGAGGEISHKAGGHHGGTQEGARDLAEVIGQRRHYPGNEQTPESRIISRRHYLWAYRKEPQ